VVRFRYKLSPEASSVQHARENGNSRLLN